jgi:hypothetical protein
MLYELWHGNKPKLSFLKIWGCETYIKRLMPDKLEAKVDARHPKEIIGYTLYHRSEGKVFACTNSRGS